MRTKIARLLEELTESWASSDDAALEKALHDIMARARQGGLRRSQINAAFVLEQLPEGPRPYTDLYSKLSSLSDQEAYKIINRHLASWK